MSGRATERRLDGFSVCSLKHWAGEVGFPGQWDLVNMGRDPAAAKESEKILVLGAPTIGCSSAGARREAS